MLFQLRTRLTYANVMATIAVFVALGGSSYAAIKVTGKNVKDSSLTGKDVRNSSLTGVDVKNGSLLAGDFGGGQLPAGPQGPKGDTGAKGDKGEPGGQGAKGDKGDACLSSDPACRGPQGTPGTNGTNGTNGTDGAPGPPGPSANMINVSMSNGGAQQTVSAGPYSLTFNCSGAVTHRLFTMDVSGGSGGAQLTGIKSIQDGSHVMFSKGDGVPTGSPFVAVGVGHPNPNNTSGFYYRLGGTLVLHNGLGVTTVVFDMFLDNRNNAGTCQFRGTGVQSGLIQ